MARLRIRVIPNARRTEFRDDGDGHWTARVTAPPVDGKANAAVIALVAEHWKVPKRNVTIVRGETARIKIVEVTVT